MNRETDNEILRQRLYRIFRIYEENYITTVKIFYIYHWVEKYTPEPLTIMERLYGDWPIKRRNRRLDDLFRTVQTAELSHLAASSDAVVPVTNRYIGVQKW